MPKKADRAAGTADSSRSRGNLSQYQVSQVASRPPLAFLAVGVLLADSSRARWSSAQASDPNPVHCELGSDGESPRLFRSVVFFFGMTRPPFTYFLPPLTRALELHEH